jgi:hypothetical protein
MDIVRIEELMSQEAKRLVALCDDCRSAADLNAASGQTLRFSQAFGRMSNGLLVLKEHLEAATERVSLAIEPPQKKPKFRHGYKRRL